MQFEGQGKCLAVMGPGLLGGSLALAWSERMGAQSLLLWGRREKSLEQARGVLPESCLTTDSARVAREADFIILATPVGAMRALVEQLLAGALKPGAVVTDVGSVKAGVQRELAPLFDGTDVHFAGSHPMTGSEQTGFAAANAGLFNGAACVVTGEGAALESVCAFWEWLGCRVHSMEPGQHDAAVAKVSHVPHLLACLGILNALEGEPALGALAGGGLRDTTRVASGSPELWTEILLENRDALRGPLERLGHQLGDLLAILEASDHEALRRWLQQAKDLRDTLNEHSPASP